MSAVTTVINTFNSEKTLENTLKSVMSLGPIVVVDMQSDDKTQEIAKKYNAKIYEHERVGYVEPARNFAISKAETEWILILDSDEEITNELKVKIQQITQSEQTEATHVYMARKNMIFGIWIQHTGWWPDEKMRLFKKGTVTWKNEIHAEPQCSGTALHLPHTQELAILHHHYNTVSEWVTRMDRYTSIQAKQVHQSGYCFKWQDLIRKPQSEFITRFFVWEGWKDGYLGLALSAMQALSELIVYMKVWEIQKQEQKNAEKFLTELKEELDNTENELGYYLEKIGLQSKFKRWIKKILP